MKHSFLPHLTAHTHALFLGTLPGDISLLEQKYYAHPQNKFWKLFYGVCNQDFEEDYDKRVEFFLNKGFGLWDVLRKGERQGSLDTAIKNFEINDFVGLHENYPNVKTLYFTSKQAYRWYFKKYKEELPYRLVVLSSPSPANARMTFDQKLEDWRQKIVLHP